jgi:ATP-dependent protease ClpP protease subunit
MKRNEAEGDYTPEGVVGDAHRALRQVPFYDVVRGQAAYLNEALCSLALEDPGRGIDLILRSYGGPINEAISCGDAITQARALLDEHSEVNGCVSGYCESAGVYLLQMCHIRSMTEHSYLMVHGWLSGVNGDFKAFLADVRQTDILSEGYLKAFTSRAKPPKRTKLTWDGIFADATPIYLNAKESLEWGLIDQIIATPVPQPSRRRRN